MPLNSAFFDYAEAHGLALLPIPYGFKEDPGWKPENRKADDTLKPIVWRWSKECSNRRADWEAWYAQYKCNFGIAAAISGYVVFDLDVSKDPDVWAKFCTFWKAYGIEAPSPQFQSARKGWHVLIKAPEGFDFSTLKQSPLMDAVDTRVDGYIVAPGSYYDGTPNCEDSGHYQMVANAPPPHNRPDLFPVLMEVCGRKSHPKTTKSRSLSSFNSEDVDLSLLPPLDEIAARVRHAYDHGPVSLDGATGKWTLNPAAHASNPDPTDRARREGNGYFAHYAQWMPVVGAIKALYGESAKSSVYPLMDRGREHKQMFASAWVGKTPAPDVAYAALKAFISASNALGFNDGGRYAKVKSDQVLQRLSSAVAAITGTTPSTAPAVSHRLIQSSAEFVANFVAPSYLLDGILQKQFCYSLTAATGAGKTAIALRLAAHVALGRKIGDRDVERGKVLYFAAENYVDVQARWIAMAEHCGFDVNAVDAYFVAGATRLSEISDRVTKEAKAIGDLALVVVDTSAATFEGDDENGNVHAGTHARRMRSLTELRGRPTVLVLCHPVKNATNENLVPRGGGAFIAEVDGNLCARKSDSAVEVHWTGKFRGMDFAPIIFRLDTVTAQRLKDARGRNIPTVMAAPIDDFERQAMAVTERNDQDQVLKAVEELPGASLNNIAEHLNWRMRDGKPYGMRVTRAIRKLANDGLVMKHRDEWVLSKDGQKELNNMDWKASARATTAVTPPLLSPMPFIAKH